MTELISRLDQTRFEVHVACFRRQGRWLPNVEAVATSVTCFPLTSFQSVSAAREIARFVAWCRHHRIAVVHACDFYANVFALTGGGRGRGPVRSRRPRGNPIPHR